VPRSFPRAKKEENKRLFVGALVVAICVCLLAMDLG
jgi:hypothetical protein